MKITVNRRLNGGIYWVGFKVGELTQEEVHKMQSFGIPTVPLTTGVPPQQTAAAIAINKVTENFQAGFRTEQEAKAYEDKILSHVRKVMKDLREKQDGFTSTAEVDV
jgi:hypothetical protein